MTVWTALAAAARDLVLGETCAACGAPTVSGALCAGCAAGVAVDPRKVRPLTPPHGFPPTMAASAYDGVVARLVVAHKERGRLPLARPLGALLAAGVVAGGGSQDGSVVLIPVPSRRATTRRRGHDPVAGMARAAALALGEAVTVRAVLGHRRRVADQSGLDLQQRQANLAGALHVTGRLNLAIDADLVVVDDICSSGSTLAAAARALRAAGVAPQRIRAAVVATPVLLKNAGSAVR